MPYDVSGTGFSLTVKASVTFPQGFTVSAFADDADPWDAPSLDVATLSMNVNGDMVAFSAPQVLTRTVNVIPGSEDDNNLSILYEANRVGKGKRSARDVVTIVANWPDGSTETLGGGKINTGMSGKSLASAGKIKSRSYGFGFESYSATRATTPAGQ
jgi:hypothetical protein